MVLDCEILVLLVSGYDVYIRGDRRNNGVVGRDR